MNFINLYIFTSKYNTYEFHLFTYSLFDIYLFKKIVTQ